MTHYYGPYAAIQDVNFGVKRGEILGFLGPNGAGKTTTMRILTGYMPPTRGRVTVDGYDIVERSLEVRRKIGYLPETVPLYTDMTVTNYLRYMGTLRGMAPRDIKRRIDDVIGDKRQWAQRDSPASAIEFQIVRDGEIIGRTERIAPGTVPAAEVSIDLE